MVRQVLRQNRSDILAVFVMLFTTLEAADFPADSAALAAAEVAALTAAEVTEATIPPVAEVTALAAAEEAADPANEISLMVRAGRKTGELTV